MTCCIFAVTRHRCGRAAWQCSGRYCPSTQL